MSASTTTATEVAQPFITTALDNYLREKRRQKGPRPTADGTRGRGSKARHCAREIAFGAQGIPPEREPNYRSMIAFFVGQSVHDEIDRVMIRDFDARTEVPISYRPDHDFSGNADFVYDFNPETGERRPNLITGETKSMTKWSFNRALGLDQYGKPAKPWKNGNVPPPCGPKIEHITQAALYGNSPQLQSAYLHMVYFCKDNGDVAEWLLPLDEPLAHLDGNPTPRQLALGELARFDGIFGLIDDGTLPARIHPDEGLILQPSDDVFACKFCDYRTLCTALPAERCKVEDVDALIEHVYDAPPTDEPASVESMW